jgi:ATP-dependent helicase/nuclease subunit B
VIAAGSTGSIPATAALLKAIATLPRGVLVLPGLDTSFSPEQHKRMLEGDATESHPQYGLMKLLRGSARAWSMWRSWRRRMRARGSCGQRWRLPWKRRTGRGCAQASRLPRRSMVSASSPRPMRTSRLAPLRSRHGRHLWRADQSASCRATRRWRGASAAELKRHGIEVDDAAGTPLFQAAAGRLARQVLAVAASNFAPIDTIALLRNGAVTLGLDRFAVRRATDHLDLKLRRVRPLAGLPGLHALSEDETLHEVLNRFGAALAPVIALGERPQLSAAELATALVAAMDALADHAELPGMAEFRRWAEEVAALGAFGRELSAALPRLGARGTARGDQGALAAIGARRHQPSGESSRRGCRTRT